MAENIVNSVIRVKQPDGSYTTILPQTKVANVTDDAGRTMVEILAEDVAEKEHTHKYVSDVPSTATVGGIDKGFTSEGDTVEEMLFKLLHPYVKPTISYSCSPNGGVYEIGAAVPNVTVTATGNRQSDMIQTVKIYKNGATVVTEDWNKAGNCTATFADTNISTNTSYKADVYDGKNTVTSTTTNFTFVRPAYIGYLDADINAGITADMITAMTKKVQNPGNLQNAYTVDNKRMCIATPPGWTIKTIIDPNGFDITASFASYTVSVTCLDGQSVDYNVLVSDPTTQNNFTVKFNKA